MGNDWKITLHELNFGKAFTNIYKIFETNSSFYVKLCPTGKLHFLFFYSIFQEFLTSIKKILILAGGQDRQFIILASFEIILIFPNLNLTLFVNSWGNSYIPYFLLIIALRFTCGERKIWWDIKKSQNMEMIVAFSLHLYKN